MPSRLITGSTKQTANNKDGTLLTAVAIQAPIQTAAATVGTAAVDVLVSWLKIAGGIIATGVILRFFFRSFLADIILDLLRHRESEFRDWLSNEVYRERYKRVDLAVEVALANKDKLLAVEQSMLVHGAEIQKLNITVQDMPRMADALERIDSSMEKLATGMSETREMVMHMRGEWDGVMRRSTDPR